MLSLIRFSNAISRWEVTELRKAGSRPTRLDIMNALDAHNGTMAHSALTKWTFHSSHGLTAMIDTLEKKGFVKREPDPKDRRAILISLTDKGKQYLKNVKPHGDGMSQRLLSCLNDEEIEMIYSLTRRIREHIRDQISKPPTK